MSMSQQIQEKLTSGLKPVHLEVINETHMHNVPKDAESHFKGIIVSEQFSGLPLIKQHRMVNAALTEELSIIHALALHTYTPDQWFALSNGTPESPPCHGGSNA